MSTIWGLWLVWSWMRMSMAVSAVELHVAVRVEAFGGQVVVRVQACAAHLVRQLDHLLGGVGVGCACVEQHARLPVCMPSFEHGEQSGEVDHVDTGVV